MRSFLLVLACSLFALSAAAVALAEPPARPCPRALPGEPVQQQQDYKWNASVEEVEKEFRAVPAAGKRLAARAYWDESLGAYAFPSEEGPVRIDARFLTSVTRHLEIALERRYADWIFFPDMGHSHFHLPPAEWERVAALQGRKAEYEALMQVRGMKILYHTAEQLKMRGGKNGNEEFLQDRVLNWRYFSRNVVGDNDGGENVYPLFHFGTSPPFNSVSEIDGLKLWSAGFNVSDSPQGCFPYRKGGEVRYFDLSLEDLPWDPARGGGEDAKTRLGERIRAIREPR